VDESDVVGLNRYMHVQGGAVDSVYLHSKGDFTIRRILCASCDL
jgi:hypothetical protein